MYIEYQTEQAAVREVRKKEKQTEWFLRDVRSNGMINQRRLSSMAFPQLLCFLRGYPQQLQHPQLSFQVYLVAHKSRGEPELSGENIPYKSRGKTGTIRGKVPL